MKELRLAQMKELQSFIGKMSYFNAAEGGQWSKEASARREFAKATALIISQWGVTEDQFKEMYSKQDRGLTSVSDFVFPVNQIGGFKDA